MKEYPEDSIQYFIDEWWTTDNTVDLRRGRLLWAFIPYVDQRAYRWTQFCLGRDAMKILDEWLQWVMTGYLLADGVLTEFRQGLLELD